MLLEKMKKFHRIILRIKTHHARINNSKRNNSHKAFE